MGRRSAADGWTLLSLSLLPTAVQCGWWSLSHLPFSHQSFDEAAFVPHLVKTLTELLPRHSVIFVVRSHQASITQTLKLMVRKARSCSGSSGKLLELEPGFPSVEYLERRTHLKLSLCPIKLR